MEADMIFPKPTPPAAPLYETWYEMKVRFIRERNEAVQRCIDWGLSQGGAAKFLGIPKGTLRSHMHIHGIKWPDRRATQ
jgi:hypothetical protein